MSSMLIFWIGALVLLVVVEALTTQLVTIWFAFGAAGAVVANLLGAQYWVQWSVFIFLSVISLIVTRPLVKKFTKRKVQPTNADRNIGAKAIVLEDIDNTAGTGAVNVRGVVWTARSVNGERIEKDTNVVVKAIEGVKLLVQEDNA